MCYALNFPKDCQTDMKFADFLIFIVPTLTRADTVGQHSAPFARTLNGSYTGTSLPGLEQELFLGIPYAQAPTGSLRYRPPQHPNSTWTGRHDATKLPNACPQYPVADGIYEQGISMSEDCLALNIVKPAGDSAGLPVLVWIHGGSYQNVSPAGAITRRR